MQLLRYSGSDVKRFKADVIVRWSTFGSTTLKPINFSRIFMPFSYRSNIPAMLNFIWISSLTQHDKYTWQAWFQVIVSITITFQGDLCWFLLRLICMKLQVLLIQIASHRFGLNSIRCPLYATIFTCVLAIFNCPIRYEVFWKTNFLQILFKHIFSTLSQ